MTQEQRELLLNSIEKRFRTFGGGDANNSAEWNPIAAALKGKPLQFAAGTDVEQVIDFIERYIVDHCLTTQ